MTHFPERPRGCPACLSSRCELPAEEGLNPRPTLGWPILAYSDGWGGGRAEARTAQAYCAGE